MNAINGMISKFKLIRRVHITVLFHIIICTRDIFLGVSNPKQVSAGNCEKWNSNLCPFLCAFEDGCPLLCGNWTNDQLTIPYCFFTTLTFSQGQNHHEQEKLPLKLFNYLSIITSFTQICTQLGRQ